MNEQAFKELYEEFKSTGYLGTEADFKTLMSTNTDAFNDGFSQFKNTGYNGDADAFAQLIGVSNPLKKKDESGFITQDPNGELVTENISSATQPQTEQDFFEGTFGDILRGFDAVTRIGLGDFIDDMSRSVATGYYQGQVAEDASDILLRGANATDEDIYSFIEANKEAQKLGPSDEMMAYQKTYEENGKGFMGVVMGLYESGLQVIPEVIVSSIFSMASNKDSRVAMGTVLGAGAAVGATTGAAGGTAVLPIVGTVAGTAGGAIAGAAATLPYAFAAAGSVLEMGATFSELLQEEIEGELTPEKIREALNDDKIYTSLRNRALARGLTIGVIDAFTGRLGGKVAGKILSKGGKGVTKGTKIKSVLAASGVESVGGSVGEATARGVIGQEMDISEIALEGIAEAPGGIKDVISARFSKPKYRVNGKKVDVETIDNLIETMTLDQLQSTKIKIDNDYEGRAEKLSNRIIQLNTERLILEANPDINPETLAEITKLQLELSKLEGNKTEVAKEKASILKAKIKDLQENQLEAEVDTEVDAFRELEQSEQLKYIEQASKELVEESEAKGDEEFEITEQQNLERAVELFNKDQQTETDTEVEVTPEKETEVKEERYKDSQIPVSQQKITYEDPFSGEIQTATITTQLDGSRKVKISDEEGTVFSSETISKNNTLTNEEYVTNSAGEIKTTEDVDIKTVINPKLESRMSDRQRKAAGLDVTPEAEVEVDDEVVYEMNKTNKRTWSKDFEIIDNRNGLELGPVEESNKWAVRNKVTGEMVTVDTKKDAQNIIANAPAYAEMFGDGTKVEADMLVTPAPAPKAEVKVEAETEAESTPEVFKDEQVILKEEVFSLTEPDGSKYRITLRTNLDGSFQDAINEVLDVNGEVVNTIRFKLDEDTNGISAEESFKKQLGSRDVFEKIQEKSGKEVNSKKIISSLTTDQKKKLGIKTPTPKVKVKVEEQVEVTPEGNERVNQVVDLSPNFREDNGEIIMGGLSVKVKDLLAMTDDKFNAFVKDVTKKFKLKTSTTPQTDPEISRLENEIEDDQMSVETFQEEITIEKDNFREEVARIKEEKAKIRKNKSLSKDQKAEAIEEKIAEQEDLKEEMDGVIESYRDDMKQKQSEIRKAKKAIEKIKKKASSKPRKQVTKVEKQVTKVEKQIDNARKALEKLDKDIKIVLHSDDASYRKATGEEGIEDSSSGEYNPRTKTIHINATKVQDNTVAHEVFHALLLRNGITNKQAKAITDRMFKAVKKTASPELLEKLKKHSDKYESALESEESIAELFGLLASEYPKMDAPTQNLVQRWLNKLAKILGVKKFTDAEVIDLLNVVSAKVEAGQEITEQDVAILDGSVSGVINGQARKQDSVLTSFTLKRFPTNPNIKLSEDTPLSNFNQKKSNLLESDRMTGAFIADVQNNPVFKFFGGIYFPQITGKWWASRTLSKATSIAENMNANRDKDGYIYGTPIIMKPNSHMSNQDMFETVWEFMKFDLRSKSSKVTKKLFSEYLTKALTLKSVNLTESDLNIKKSDNIETMITKLNKVLLGDDTTLSFEKRKAIIKAILGDPKVTEDRKFPTAGSISEVASKFEEEKTKKATKLWDIVMLMRTKGTLSTKVTPKSDEFYHKSYPAEISSDQEIEVFFLDGAYNIDTTYPELTQSSGKVFSWKEYSEKHPSTAMALSQYGRTAKLSKASGDIVAPPQSRKQKTIQQAARDFNMSETGFFPPKADSYFLKRAISRAEGDYGVKKSRTGSFFLVDSRGKKVNDLFKRPQSRKQIIGENADLTALNLSYGLNLAKEIESFLKLTPEQIEKGALKNVPIDIRFLKNKTPEELKYITGWERGKDNKWRYELPDGKLTLRESGTFKLSDVYDSKDLYKAYPQLKDMKVEVDIRPQGAVSAWFIPSDKSIEINAKPNSNVTSLLVHEIQHAIQFIEGFATGGNMMSAFEAYENTVTPEEKVAETELKEEVEILKNLSTVLELASIDFEGMSLDEVLDLDFMKENFDVLGLEEVGDAVNVYEYVYDNNPEIINKLKTNEFSNSLDLEESFEEASVIASEKQAEYSDKYSTYGLYQRLAGEVESRNVEKRYGMREEKRRETLLEATEDVAREDQILLFPDAPQSRKQVNLAPNGKPSNLNQEQYDIVRTPEFKNWFGDWETDPANASKVVDENGEPLVVYHGTPDGRFLDEDGIFKSQDQIFGMGSRIGVHWFAKDITTAKSYAKDKFAFDYQNSVPKVLPAFLNIKNPFIKNGENSLWRNVQQKGKTRNLISKALESKKDGVIVDNVKDNYNNSNKTKSTDTFTVFNSNQIKLADGSNITFDPEAPSVRKQKPSGKKKPSKKPTRKRTSSIKKAITEIKNVLKITPDEQRKIFKALNDQKKRAKDIKKDIVASLRELTKQGKLTPSKMVSVINKVPDDFNNPITVERFVEYMTKVFNDADYGNKMMIANTKKGKARKNVSTKLGIAEGLVDQLQRLFSVKPSLIPDSVLDQYMELINIFGKRETVLSLPPMEQVVQLTEDVLQQLDEEQSMAIELADRYKNAEKVIGDNGVDYAATIKQMLDNEIITEREYEVMKKYKSQIKPAEPATPKTEAEIKAEIEAERQEVIKDVKATKEVDPSVFPSRLERDLAKRFKKLLKTDAINDLSLDDLKNLFKVIDNINNGYLPHYAQIMVGKMNAINDAKVGTNAINRSKLLPLSKIYANLKAKFGRTGKSPTLELIRRNPTFYIDQVFGDFKTKDIFNSIFKRSAEASAKYTKAIKEVQAKIEKVEQAVFKSFGRNPNKVIMSKYKQMSYLIQQEFLSNPDSNQVNSVKDFLKATIKRIKTETTSYTETDAKMLQEILDKYTANGTKPFDIDQLYESFNVAERNSIRTLEEINKSMTDKAVYTANIIRGNKITPLKNYTHLSVIPDVSKADIIETETSQISDMFNKYLKPSTKAKSLIERTGKVSPLNFDVYASVQRGAKYTLMDFNLTEPIRTARRTLNQIEKNLSDEDGNMSVSNRRKFNAIRDASVESIENLLSNALTQNTIADQAVNYIQKQGYRAILAGIPRASYELLSNILAGIYIDPKGIISGIKNRKLLASPEGKEVMNNLNSTQTNRVFSTGLSGKFVDTGILNQAAGVTASRAKGRVKNTILQLWNKTGQRWIKGVEFTADSLISAPDKLVMQPMWFGAFENRFKQLTGKSPDFDKIAANDEAYMNKYATELNDAKTLADNRSVAMGATDNAFMGILKGTVKPNQGILLRGFNAFNGFMTRFLIFEYITARTGIMAAVGNGQINKRQGAALLAGVTTRMMAYTFMGTLVAEAIKDLTEDDDDEDIDFSNFQFEDDDEQGMKSVDKMLGQAMVSAFTSLLFGRDFGNATKSIINLGLENLNEAYGQFLRDGDYDKYRDAIQYTIIPEGKSGRPPQFGDVVPNLFAAYSPMIKTTVFGINKIFESDRVQPDAIERQQDERFIRLPLETFGVLGFIPFYKDIRKIVLSDMYKGLRKAKKDAANKKKRKEEMLQGYDSESDMKRYDFSLWERTFGPDSPGYETRQAEKELKRKERKLRQQEKDKMYDYTPPKKEKNSSLFGPSTKRKSKSSSKLF